MPRKIVEAVRSSSLVVAVLFGAFLYVAFRSASCILRLFGMRNTRSVHVELKEKLQ